MLNWLSENLAVLVTAVFALIAAIQTARVAKLSRLGPIIDARLAFGKEYGPLLADAQSIAIYFLASMTPEAKQSGRVPVPMDQLSTVQTRMRALEPYVAMIFESRVVDEWRNCVQSLSNVMLDAVRDPQAGMDRFLGNESPFQKLTSALREASGLHTLDPKMKSLPAREREATKRKES